MIIYIWIYYKELTNAIVGAGQVNAKFIGKQTGRENHEQSGMSRGWAEGCCPQWSMKKEDGDGK